MSATDPAPASDPALASDPAPASDPALKDAAAVVAEMARRFQGGDRDGALRLMHPAIRVQQPASLPHGGWHDGQAGMAEMNASFGAFWDRTVTNPRILGCGSTAVQVTTQTWTAKATGRAATVDVVELFSVTDGAISEIRVFQQDTQLLLKTLQATEP